MYIYIYIERERDVYVYIYIERERYTHVHMYNICMYIYIYIYIHITSPRCRGVQRVRGGRVLLTEILLPPSNCLTGNCLTNFNERISSKVSN